MTAPPPDPAEEDRIAALSAFDDALAGLTAALEEAPKGDLTARQHDALARIAESGRRLLGLIDDLLGGGFDLDRSEIGIDELARSSLLLVEDAARERAITTRLRIEGAHATIEGDRRRLRHALVIVLRNAVRFTPPGGAIGLDVSIEGGGRVVRFTAWDTGRGMSERELARVFDPPGGLYEVGTGLSIVREIAALHRGGVEIDTEPEGGCRVSIIVPRGAPEGAIDAPFDAPIESGRASLARHRVLLATRDEAAIAALSEDLAAARFDVVPARAEDEAIDRAWAHEPDMMLIDARFRGADPFTVMAAVRASPSSLVARIPIVAFTALALPGDRERCLAAGADAFLVGPVIPARLLAMLETMEKGSA